MSQAEHFLAHLNRLAGHEVELSLLLYGDPELVRLIAEATALPEGADQFAISLQDPTLGPFLVVTRGGDFVACLGRGVGHGDLPVVTQPELDACARAGTLGFARSCPSLAMPKTGSARPAKLSVFDRAPVARDPARR